MLLLCVGCGADTGTPPVEPAQPETPSLSFTDVTEAAGLQDFQHETGAKGQFWFPETMGSGGGFFDLNGDAYPDLILLEGGAPTAKSSNVWVYQNQGDGTFVLHGKSEVAGSGFGMAVADVDNDGDADLFITALGRNALLRNEGGELVDVTEAAGLGGRNAWSTAAVFFDADKDGWADLFVGNYVVWSPENDVFCSHDGKTKGYCTPELYQGEPGRFYRNRGDGTFEDQTTNAGFEVVTGKTLGATALDYNRDGWMDLAIANDTEPDLLLQNRGDGTFTEEGLVSGFAFDQHGRARAGMGIDAGVLDATGNVSVAVGNFSNEMIGLYRHQGSGMLLDRAAASRIGRASLLTLTFGLFFFDADLDGDLDLITANGHVQPGIETVKDNVTYRQPPHLFLNQSDGTFDDVAPLLGGALAQPLVGRGAAYADYDGDGDLDILLTENGGLAHLWRNNLDGANYLRVNILAPESALGTRVVAVAGGQRQERWITSGASYLSASEQTATFGLGPATQVDSLLVYWPDGTEAIATEVPANQVVHWRKGSTRAKLIFTSKRAFLFVMPATEPVPSVRAVRTGLLNHFLLLWP